MYKTFIVATALLLQQTVFTQDLSLYEKHWFFQSGDKMPYRILFPENYDAQKKYPLVLFLHGRGESGSDNEKQLVHGASLFLRDSIRKQFPAIVVFPQCSEHSYWSNVQMVVEDSKNNKRSFFFVPAGPPSSAMEMVLSLLNNLITRYPVNRQRIYVMGLSMGGMGTFEIVRRRPQTFAAAIAICGGAHPATARQIRRIPWWIFHGAKDDVVLPKYSEQMVEALKKVNADVRFTLFPDANHNAWDPAFAQPGLLNWLFDQKKIDRNKLN